MLAFSHLSNKAPDASPPWAARYSEKGAPADVSSLKNDQRVKGAAARKAAEAAARDKLYAAREAALTAKTRAVEVGGELYYMFTEALDAAQAADALARGIAHRGDCERASSALLLVRYLHPGVTADDVRELFSYVSPPIYVRLQASIAAAVPKTARGLEYNEAELGYADSKVAIDTQRVFDGTEILDSGCVKIAVRGTKNDDMDEEANNELDEYHKYEDGSGDDSDNDLDDMDCL